MYDVFFISFDERNAEDHWNKLIRFVPSAKRVHGVPGIHAAHRACAERARTGNLWIIDADNEVLDGDFSLRLETWDREYVHVWHARNPVNGLEYGWGGIKLFPKRALLDLADMPLDMTTSFPLKIVPKVKSITHFDTTPFEAWRAAFRECAKLAAAEPSEETLQRLSVWRTHARGFEAAHVLDGAEQGFQYGISNKGDDASMQRINQYDWLQARFGNPVR